MKTDSLARVAASARQAYAALVAGMSSAAPWWTAVIVTASSDRQAERYRAEIDRRREGGKIPEKAQYLVVPDPGRRRIGSGGATIHALGALAKNALVGREAAGGLEGWWSRQHVLIVHCGGDSRRLPQYSLSGKLFSAVPVETPWGDTSTIFDEMMALSSGWVEQLPAGLVVSSGDVILTFDAQSVDWKRPGVTGVGLLQQAEVGTGHGVYIADEQGRVYAFLQKPSVAEVTGAGGVREGGLVAVDSGLLRFDPAVAARLTELSGIEERDGKWSLGKGILEGRSEWEGETAEIDLYQHFTMALTDQWKPEPGRDPALDTLAAAMRNLPFWCSVVPGDFTHIGTTTLFRRLMTEDTDFSRLHRAQRRLGAMRQPGVNSAGVIADSVLAGGAELKPGTVVIECNLAGPVRVGAGAVLHGLDGISGGLEIPEDTVVHQLPVLLPNGNRGVVVRVYGVTDDPKAAGAAATWFGRSLVGSLQALNLDAGAVWPGMHETQRTLWNARLFPVAAPNEAWECAQWMMRLGGEYGAEQWSVAERLSLATSTEWADAGALEAARARRWKAYWCRTAISLVESGSDIVEAGKTNEFRLHLDGGGKATPGDPRILNFRVFEIQATAWRPVKG